jgi:SPP1 family predicted phage head-tail adaptor
MNPGKLDRRITFARLVQTENAFQDYTYAWVDVLTTWAQVRPQSGRRQLEAGEQVISEGTIFTTRYRRDFTPTKEMRILYKDRYYTIHSVRDIEDRHRFNEIITRVTDENTPENAAS